MLSSLGAAASLDTLKEQTSERLYKVYSGIYLYQRSLEFTLDMTLREVFLGWLFNGIKEEVRHRRKEDWRSALEDISLPELPELDKRKFQLPPDFEELNTAKRYVVWEKLVRSEFNNKYLQARLIKDRLINSADPEQLHRMFRFDLNTAFKAYIDADYREAILYFDELINRYGYRDISDVMFYRGESYFALQLFPRAKEDFQHVLDNSEDPRNRRIALSRLLAVYGEEGNAQKLAENWSQYKIEAGDVFSEEYWNTVSITARYIYIAGDPRQARELFDLIPPESGGFLDAQLLAADCALELLELKDAERRYTNILAELFEGETFPRKKREQAQLKLGYVYFLQGDYDMSFVEFSGIKHTPEIVEKATIASAWSMYKLGFYNKTIELCQDLIAKFPDSQHLYEALSLTGFCRELSGEGGTSQADYTTIMSSIDDRQEYRDLNNERKFIFETLVEIDHIEPLVFLEGQKDLFETYMNLRKRLMVLVNKIRIIEGLKYSPKLSEMLDEQRKLFVVMTANTDLEAKLMDLQNAKLFDQFDKVMTDMVDVISEVNAGIETQLKKQTLIQKEEFQKYQTRKSDSLRVRLQREWEASEYATRIARKYLLDAKNSHEPELMASLAGMELDLFDVQDRLLSIRRDLQGLGGESVSSNLDRWSDFAYQRYTYGGLNFGDFEDDERRLEHLDTYIQSIDRLLSSNIIADQDTSQIDENLIPVTDSDIDQYIAPPVPLWKPPQKLFRPAAQTIEKKKAEQPPTKSVTPEEANEVEVSEPVPQEESGESPDEETGDDNK